MELEADDIDDGEQTNNLVASSYFLALVLFSKVITTRLSKCPRRRRTILGLCSSTQTRPETLSLGAVELLDLPSAISQNPHPKSLFPILHPTVFPRA